MPEHGDAALTFRAATSRDVEDLAALSVVAWQSYRGLVSDAYLDALEPRSKFAAWTRRLADPRARVSVALRAARLLGYCALQPSRDPDAQADTLELTHLCVDSRVWRRGIGRRFVSDAIEHARSHSFRELTLWALLHDARARAFYEACGFVLDGATKVEERPAFVLDEVRYRRELRAP